MCQKGGRGAHYTAKIPKSWKKYSENLGACYTPEYTVYIFLICQPFFTVDIVIPFIHLIGKFNFALLEHNIDILANK